MNEGGSASVPNLKEMFCEIQINSFWLIMQPLLSLFCLDKCCGASKQQKILEKVEEKFSAELDITVLLNKLRMSYAVINKLINSKT